MISEINELELGQKTTMSEPSGATKTVAEQAVAAEWDNNADLWARSLSHQLDVINERFGIPQFLDFLGNVEGLDVLDAGCGEGRSARHLAARGARVTGVDISCRMIDHARRQEEAAPRQIDFQVASCSDLSRFAPHRFGMVVSVMALMDTPDLAGALREFARLIKPGGEIAIMVRHPCFFTRGYTLLHDKNRRSAGLAVADYFQRESYLELWRFPNRGQTMDAPFTVNRYPHTLADYINGLLVYGFRLTGVMEPQPAAALCTEFPNLGFWRRHAALYLFLRGRKETTALMQTTG